MKTAILANAALCLCPPLIAVATTAAAPPVRTAVHHLTAPHRHHGAKKRPSPPPCAPFQRVTAAAGLPRDENPLAADLLPGDADASLQGMIGTLSGGQPLSAIGESSGITAGVGTGTFPFGPGPIIGPGPNPPTGPLGPQPPAVVPEPASWAMMVAGFLGIGLLVRRRGSSDGRRVDLRRVSFAATLELLGSVAFGSGQTAALASVKAASTVKGAVAAAIAKKAAVCVCSGAILATAVTTVPPLRRAVYSATVAAPALLAECRPSS